MPLQEVRSVDDRALQDIADLLVKSHKVILITGAGISTSCGIPDFRSKDGLYNIIPDQNGYPTPPSSQPGTPSRKRKACTTDDDEFTSSQSSTSSRRSSTPVPRLKGQDLFDSRVWSSEGTVEVFYQFIASLRQKIRDDVKETSLTHKFIRTLRDGGRLMRCYTQNIDGLEAREGLCMDMSSGRGNKRRFMKKNYEAPLPELTMNTDFDAGCEVVQLHGDLDRLRCNLCQGTFEWTDDSTEIYLDGQAPECEKCCMKSDAREATGKRGLSVGTLRPNIVLYGEDHPSNHLLAPLVPFDISSGPEVLIIMGTSLKVFGLQKIVRDFAKAIHSKKDAKGDCKGRVIFVNRTRPAESVWEGILDDYVSMDCDEWVQDLRTRREDLWLRQGELDLKVTKPAVKRKRKSTESDQDKENRPAKKVKITVEIPRRKAKPKKALAMMDISSILNPSSPCLNPRNYRLEQQALLSHAHPAAEATPETPSHSRKWTDTLNPNPVAGLLSALARNSRPLAFISPIAQSFKQLVRDDMGILRGSPQRPEWSPITRPSPLSSRMDVYKDPVEDLDMEIAESDEESKAEKEEEVPSTPSKSTRHTNRLNLKEMQALVREIDQTANSIIVLGGGKENAVPPTSSKNVHDANEELEAEKVEVMVRKTSWQRMSSRYLQDA